MRKFVALLRGINVGGHNIITMTDLRTCFERAGFSDVVTYIQSGNVICTSVETDISHLAKHIETALAKTFQKTIPVVVVSHEELHTIVHEAPKGFGKKPDLYRYDVMFLAPSLSAKTAAETVPINPDVDQVYVGRGVLYFSRLIAKAIQSKLPKLITLPLYKQMTIRNWNTTTKLLELMEK